ncbi:GntR family transcriptional regulator [Castellaniella sp.]|uniref:GntR family transcriptional regulator n=1 Tax=Castellaniella sp. TaxID=1955812 RepID=UPI003C74C15F
MKKQQSEILRDAIEEMVATGELKPGQYLEEGELAKRFEVSRTPIREALLQLGSVGIVEIRPRRRARVAQFDPPLLVEMFEVMAELEAMCGRLAARRMSPEDLDELALANENCRVALSEDHQDAYYYANEKFHELLYVASRNRCLAEQARNLHRRLRPYRRLQLRLRARVSQSFEEHCAIVRALQEHDEKAVDHLMRTHITMHTQRFSELMAFLASVGNHED